MKKTILALALVAGLTSFAGNAKAGLTFDFSFQGNPNFGSTNLITGFLTLNDSNTAATSFYVSSGFGLNNPTGLDFATQGWFFIQNSFTVIDGQITSAQFTSVANVNGSSQDNSIPNYSVYLGYAGVGINQFTESYYAGSTLYDAKNTSGGLTFTRTDAVPEPSTYALFGLGALALVVAYRRKVA
jgi:hypothetical protein